MKKIFFVLLVSILISPYLHPCSPKQVWIPLFIINLDANYDKIGQQGNNYVYRINIYGKFHPGTHSLELNCSQDDCCKIYDKIAKYKISYCVDQPCGCQANIMMPSKCSDIPLASFCQPEQGLSCSGPYFKQFDEFTGNVAAPGLQGGCSSNTNRSCKDTDIPILEFNASFIYQLSKNANYPYTLKITVCFIEGIKNFGICMNKNVILDRLCPEPCCPPECKPPCEVSPPEECQGDNDDDDQPDCYGKLRISSNGWITFRVLKNGFQVIPWTDLSNVNTNPALIANGPLTFDLQCGSYDIEYDEEDQLEEGNEICWIPDKKFQIKRGKITDVLANKREFHYHIKFRDGHYELHPPWECPYNNQVCHK